MFVRASSGGGSNNVYYEIYPSGSTSLSWSKTLSFEPKHVFFAMPTSSSANKEVIFHYDLKEGTLRSKAYATPSTEGDQNSHIGTSTSDVRYVYFDTNTKTLYITSPWSVANNYVNIVVTG